jgi:hypothetical protein
MLSGHHTALAIGNSALSDARSVVLCCCVQLREELSNAFWASYSSGYWHSCSV